MFSLIASMLSSSAGSVGETAVFNNTNTESDPGHHFLTGTDVVDNSNRLYTDWLFGEISIPGRRPPANCPCSCN